MAASSIHSSRITQSGNKIWLVAATAAVAVAPKMRWQFYKIILFICVANASQYLYDGLPEIDHHSRHNHNVKWNISFWLPPPLRLSMTLASVWDIRHWALKSPLNFASPTPETIRRARERDKSVEKQEQELETKMEIVLLCVCVSFTILMTQILPVG